MIYHIRTKNVGIIMSMIKLKKIKFYADFNITLLAQFNDTQYAFEYDTSYFFEQIRTSYCTRSYIS